MFSLAGDAFVQYAHPGAERQSVLFVLNHVVMAPLSILLGAVSGAAFGFPAYRCIQAAIYSRQIEKLLGDGQAIYLMPGAFTHVLVHPALPHDVILVVSSCVGKPSC